MIHPSHEDCNREIDRCLPTYAMLAAGGGGEHTPSDLMWLGIVEPLPYWLRGLPLDRPKDEPAWRRRIDKAKADIAAIDSEWRAKRLAAACTPADVRVFLEAMR